MTGRAAAGAAWRASRWRQRAATRREIPGSAASLLRRAVALLRDNDEVRRAALLDLGDALRDAQQPVQALEVYGTAIDEADAAGDRPRVRWDTSGSSRSKGFLGRADQDTRSQTNVVDDALRLFGEIEDHVGLAKAWRAKAYVHWTAGQLGKAEAASRRAIEFAQHAGDEPLKAATVSSHCFILFWDPSTSTRWRATSGRRSPRHATGSCEDWEDAMRILACSTAMQGRFPEARALLRDAAQVGAHRDLLVLVGEHLSASLVELLADDPAAAEQSCTSAMASSMAWRGPASWFR